MDNESKTYTLAIEGQGGTFAVNNLTMNGTNYVSATKVDTSNWPEIFKLTARDEGGNVTEAHAHARLLQQEQYDWDGGKFYLAFAPVSEQEILFAEQQANLEYLAMMADIDLDK